MWGGDDYYETGGRQEADDERYSFKRVIDGRALATPSFRVDVTPVPSFPLNLPIRLQPSTYSTKDRMARTRKDVSNPAITDRFS